MSSVPSVGRSAPSLGGWRSSLSTFDLGVAVRIAGYANNGTGRTHVSITRLARDGGVKNTDAVRDALERLEASGWLGRVGKVGRATEWQLTVPVRHLRVKV